MQLGYIRTFIFFFIPLLCSCRESLVNPDQIFYGAEYYPLKLKRYYIYDVDSVEYKNGSIAQSSSFQIKEILSDTFSTGSLLQYRVERFKRRKPIIDTIWPSQPDSVWSVYYFSNQIIKVENNVKIVKLVFPVEEKKKWNGNVFNNFGTDVFEMNRIGKPLVVNTNTFSNTLIVDQANDTANIVRSDYRIEVYAKDIGMILKQREVYDFVQNNPFKKINSGVKYIEKLVEYGTE